jgi:hypothetical protein
MTSFPSVWYWSILNISIPYSNKRPENSNRMGGYVRIGELHPFKHYIGTKVGFDTDEVQHELSYFNHHVSYFVKSAKRYGLHPEDIGEYSDDNIREIP